MISLLEVLTNLHLNNFPVLSIINNNNNKKINENNNKNKNINNLQLQPVSRVNLPSHLAAYALDK